MRRVFVAVIAALVGLVGLAPTATAVASQSPKYCKSDTKNYRYVVLYQPRTPQFAAELDLRLHCGTMRAYYPEIGVAVADSADAGFVKRIGANRAYSGQRDIDAQSDAGAPGSTKAVTTAVSRARSVQSHPQPLAKPTASKDLSGQQWDMAQIGAKQANKINRGSRDVVVGVLDSGIEADHPDLAKAIDPTKSAGCVGGRASTDPASWAPTNSTHGTHVAGTIAAADDGKGITGVAPGVRLASVKVANDDGYILPEAAVCGFVWAAEHGFTVTNSSYYVDPGMFYCPDEPGDSAAYEAVRRAVDYARMRNVLNVSAAGNSASDTSNPTSDENRPHMVDATCRSLPAGLPGVVSVSAVGYTGTKASYSSWGIVDVTAPGGDAPQAPPKGAGPACPLSTVVGKGYGSLCGTSMASPHAAGVAALLASTHPHASVARLRALLTGEADPVACQADESVCTGPAADNDYYGHGLVDALRAVR